jgi:predicted alpha/beta superfamily hydrolase
MNKQTQRVIAAVALTAAVSAAVTYAVSRYFFERPVLGPGVVVSRLRSEALGEGREFLVHLPASYARDADRRYPVLYVLDGTSQDLHTAESAALMARIGVMPEILVVGIPNVSGKGRQRDYTPPGLRQDVDEADSPGGRADRFLSFLRTELVPRVEREYRTSPPRMLAGHSRGALLVVYSLIAESSLFSARFAHSPALWRDDDALVAQLERCLATSPSLDGFLYLSLGDAENEKMTKSFAHAVSVLEARAPRSFRWRADRTAGANHRSNPVYATPVGLHLFFGGERAATPSSFTVLGTAEGVVTASGRRSP